MLDKKVFSIFGLQAKSLRLPLLPSSHKRKVLSFDCGRFSYQFERRTAQLLMELYSEIRRKKTNLILWLTVISSSELAVKKP